MNRGKLAGRLYLSTIGKDSQEMAEKLGLGLEIAEFCTAVNLARDTALYRDAVLKKQARLDRFWFHAPFAELSSAAVDPRVREVTALRYRQAIQMATGLGIHRLVIHSGFIPQVYFPEWFVPQSVLLWQTFLAKAPENITIALENVMDPGPEMLVEIVRQVNDPRLGLCLDVGHANCRISKTPPLHWIERPSSQQRRGYGFTCRAGQRHRTHGGDSGYSAGAPPGGDLYNRKPNLQPVAGMAVGTRLFAQSDRPVGSYINN